MKACLTIVLRRDLSLSRRLYSWLLGPENETEEAQLAFLRKWSLDLLATALKVGVVVFSPCLDMLD
jgi:hypothetical protein